MRTLLAGTRVELWFFSLIEKKKKKVSFVTPDLKQEQDSPPSPVSRHEGWVGLPRKQGEPVGVFFLC